MKDDVFTHDCVTCFNVASIYCDHPCCQQRARDFSERSGASLPFQNNSSRQVTNRKESKRNVATNKSSKVTPTINPPKNPPSLNQVTGNNSSTQGSVCLPSVGVSHTNLTRNTTTRLLPPFNVISVASLNLPSKLQLGHKYVIKMLPSSTSSARTKASCTASGKPDQSNDELSSNTLSNDESTTLTWTVTSCSASPKQYNKTLVSNYALSSVMSSLGGNQAPESFAGLGSKYITSQISTASKVQLLVPLVSSKSEKPHLSYSAPAISVLKSPSQIFTLSSGKTGNCDNSTPTKSSSNTCLPSLVFVTSSFQTFQTFIPAHRHDLASSMSFSNAHQMPLCPSTPKPSLNDPPLPIELPTAAPKQLKLATSTFEDEIKSGFADLRSSSPGKHLGWECLKQLRNLSKLHSDLEWSKMVDALTDWIGKTFWGDVLDEPIVIKTCSIC